MSYSLTLGSGWLSIGCCAQAGVVRHHACLLSCVLRCVCVCVDSRGRLSVMADSVVQHRSVASCEV